MRLHFLVLVVAILIVIDGLPVDRVSPDVPDEDDSTPDVFNGDQEIKRRDQAAEVEEEQRDEDEFAEKKGDIASKRPKTAARTEKVLDDDVDEKKEDIDETDETTDAQPAEEKDTGPPEIEEDEDEDSVSAKKDKIKPVSKKEQDQNDEQTDTKESTGSTTNKDVAAGRKRDEECCHGHQGEHCCHHGDHCCHEGEHGEHEGHHHDDDHHHHDHGYEFYEEWGEHEGHEGEHEGHHGHEHGHEHEHHHEGEHDCCHGHHEHEAGGGKDFVPTVSKSKGTDGAKKWWMVGDTKHWAGTGHGHWGPPHHTESSGHDDATQHKSRISACCKSKNKNVRKRCECEHHEEHTEEPHDIEGYHFHEHGHGGHNDHDHELKGGWTFGYDGFGDDWNDWDHNHGNYEHLKDLDRESHEGTHELGHDDNDCSRRNCIVLQAETLPGTHVTAETMGPTIIGPMAVPVSEAAPVGVPVSLVSLPSPAPHHRPYRVCHDCHILKNGGSRCLCKSVKHTHHAHTKYDHHVYIDCDAATHKYPLCYPRADIPTPEQETHDEGKPKQGVVYPYVGYGPWASYPWWGDWWGGHGNHGWGGCTQPCEKTQRCECHKHEGCGCHDNHPTDNQVEVEHGESMVKHEHDTKGGASGHEVGFSLGDHGGSQLNAYRCHDVIENKANDESTKTKRFCVPVGYHGGYGWPYWHGYPGVGTGLWGWGWPWIKNKVPGSKIPEGRNKTEEAKGPNKSTSRRSYVESPVQSNRTKKQTIHVGYGYASGDNYRLGYGSGGMGGVAGFAPESSAIGESGSQAPFTRSKIETLDDNIETFTKNTIPKPEQEITVTGTKREFEKHNGSSEDTPNKKL